MSETARRLIRGFAAALVCYAVLFAVARAGHRSVTGGEALVAFYCAGDAANHRADPYLTESLRACEHRVDPTLYFGPSRVEPAPLPPYDFWIFRLLALVSFRLASVLWLGILIAALAAAAASLAVLAEVPLALTVTACALAPGYLNIVFGEPTPIVLAGICGAALALSYRRYAVAAACAAITTIEPHVGLPMCAGLVLFSPRTRVALGAAASACFVLGTAAVGLGGWWEYAREVLPVHARSEIAANDQLSATAFVHLAGGSDGVALAIGAASSFVMLAAGLAIARRLADDDPAWLALVPPAAILIGGSFIHDIQLPLALPAAIYGAARTRRVSLWLATFVLAAWWTTNAYTPVIGIAATLVVAAVAVELVRSHTLGPRLAIASSITVLSLFWVVHVKAFGGSIVTAKLEPMSNASRLAPLASTNWGELYRERDSRRTPASDVVGRVTLEVALVAVVATLALTPTRRSRAVST